MRNTIAALALLALPAGAVAAGEGPAPARIRHVEGDVTLQRATEAEEEPAVPNLIWLGGDRLWTAAGGRAEQQLPDGSLIHLATSSKLDLIGHDGAASALRLWAGSLSLWIPAGRERPDVVIETPDAVVSVREPGLYRIDAIAGETRLSVVRGAASLESGGERLALDQGERSWARAGEPPDRPDRFAPQSSDAFDTWVDARLRLPRHVLPAGVPEEVAPWAAELSEHGEWSVIPEVGTVWRPRSVATGWQPYRAGRWAWSPWGWTWVSAEPWGWAPYHYGRWGFSGSLGWYWSPGRTWGPAWVSWSIGSGYVGWSPLGLRGGPVFPHHRYGRGSRGWLYVHHRGLGARHLGRHRVTHARLGGARFTHLRLGYQPGRHGLRGVARRAVPRGHSAAFGRLGTSSRSRPAVRDRGSSRDRSRPAVRSRSDRSRSSVAPRSRPNARSRSRTQDKDRSLGAPSRSRPAVRDRGSSRDRSRPAVRPRSDRSRSSVTPRSRPNARSRSRTQDNDRSLGAPSRSRPAVRDRGSSRDRSRPAVRPRSDRSRSSVAPRSRPSDRSQSRPPRQTRSSASSREARPAASSSRPARDRERPAERGRAARDRERRQR